MQGRFPSFRKKECFARKHVPVVSDYVPPECAAGRVQRRTLAPIGRGVKCQDVTWGWLGATMAYLRAERSRPWSGSEWPWGDDSIGGEWVIVHSALDKLLGFSENFILEVMKYYVICITTLKAWKKWYFTDLQLLQGRSLYLIGSGRLLTLSKDLVSIAT